MKAFHLLLLFILPTVLAAQDSAHVNTDSTKSAKGSWSIIIRKGMETKDDKDKPANFSMTWPQDGKPNSYLVNTAVGLNYNRVYTGRAILDITSSFAYNRNNLVKKEQNNLKGVLSGNLLYGRSNDAENTHNFISFFSTLQYMRNKIDTSSSFFSTAYFTWVKKGKHGFAMTNYGNLGNSGFLLYISPSAGFEYQSRFDVKKPDTKGSVTRLFLGGDVRLAFKDGPPPKHQLGNKRFEFIFTYAGRNELGSNLPEKEGYIYLLKTEFDYFPIKDSDDFSIGLSYNDGQDPIAAIEKQKYWQLAFKFKHDFNF